MEARTLVTQCHMRASDRTAAVVCAPCGRSYCATHSGSLSVVRRIDRRETEGHWQILEHVPTYMEVFSLCLRCSKRPLMLTQR